MKDSMKMVKKRAVKKREIKLNPELVRWAIKELRKLEIQMRDKRLKGAEKV